jgi:acid phosphatase
VSFLVVGDWGREGKHGQAETAAQMERSAAALGSRFVISTGDNVYESGVRSVDDPAWKKSYEDIYTGTHLQTPWYAVLGNHDYLLNPQAQVDYSAKSPRWRMPARYYTWTERVDAATEVQFFALDTNPMIKDYRSKPEKFPTLVGMDPAVQLAWLDAELAKSTARWKIVLGHHPVYTHGRYHKSSPELIAGLKPILERRGVQVYLAGHEHDQQYLRDSGPVHYVVTGAGSQIRGTGTGEHTRWAEGSISGFVTCVLHADRLDLRFLDKNGRELKALDIRP